MSFLIAVDDSLSNIKDALRKQGYQTVELSMADFRDVDAYVVDKNNEDLTKRKNTIADEMVIAASDTEVDRVINTLRQKLKHYEKETASP